MLFPAKSNDLFLKSIYFDKKKIISGANYVITVHTYVIPRQKVSIVSKK